MDDLNGGAEGGAARSEDDQLEAARARVLDEALPEVPFDGWTERTLRAAIERSGVDAGLARLAFPRGALDLALYFHRQGDDRLREELERAPLAEMRMRERIAWAVRRRLEIAARDREAVRRAATLFALPPYAPEGARAIWSTADTIWTALGDTSNDSNWYTKRGILSGVISATILYWLGDASDGFRNTWAFLDRQIGSVMRFEKFKADVNANPLGRLLMTGPNMLGRMVRPPRRA